MLDLTCPNFQILIGTADISNHVTGYSFRHPLSEPTTPLIWTGQLELDLTIDTSLGASFFDDEVYPSRWLSGLQPIDVYFEGTWWQRFRIKPSGYRYDQITGQSVVELTDIIGILDSYQPSADAPEFKTGANNYWNDLAVRLINKQAALMGVSVSVQLPPYGIGGYYQIPRTVSGSYIKEAQKMAGERGFWMWSDKEVIKWAEYPQSAQNIVWQKSRRELLNYTRQQGLDPVKSKITVSATHEEVDTCGEIYPRRTYVFASSAVIVDINGNGGQRYQTIASITIQDKIITDNYIYTFTKKQVGNPMLTLFGGILEANGTLTGEPPEAKGYKVTKENAFGGFAFIYKYTKGTVSFTWDWTRQQQLLDERDVTTYENIPLDSQNASKILKRVVTRSEPYAKFPDGLQYLDFSNWFRCDVNLYPTERTTTTYTYNEIFRDDIIIAVGQKLYEIAEIVEFKEQIYFKKNAPNVFPNLEVKLVPQSKTVTTYIKQCQGRWKEIKETWLNKGQSTTSTGYLYSVDRTEQDVTAIPEITYRPSPFPVRQKPLLSSVSTNYAGVSPFVNSNEFAQASTLTTKGECEKYARYLGALKWQRYYGRELASGYGTVLNYAPFQGVYAGNGAYIRDRFGISLNREGDEWQFVEDCIGNKTGTITEIAPPSYPYPPLLTSTLNIGAIPNQSFTQSVIIPSLTFNSSGGQTPYTYSSTTLPAGLSLSSAGVLSGTPSTIATTSVTVTVTDDLGATDNASFSIAVVAPVKPISIISESTDYIIYVDEFSGISFLNGIPIPIQSNPNADDISKTFFPINLTITANDISGISFSSVINLYTYADDLSEVSFLEEIILADDISSIELLGTPPTNPLLDYTLAYFNFNDNSSNLTSYDSTGQYRFYFPSFSATFASGLIGNAVTGTSLGGNVTTNIGTSGGLESSKFDVNIAGFLGIAVWVYFYDSSTYLFSTDSSPYQFQIYFNVDSPVLRVRDFDGYDYDLAGSSMSTESWSLINIELNALTGVYSIAVNNGTPVSGSGITNYFDAFSSYPNLNDFKLQNLDSNVLFDEMYFYDTPLSTTDRNNLYNSGSGTTYPF